MKFAVSFGRMQPRLWVEAAEATDGLATIPSVPGQSFQDPVRRLA